MRKYVKTSFSIALIFITTVMHAQDSSLLKRIIPKNYIVQYAGNIGFFSLGLGYPLAKEKLHISFHYGRVPEQLGGPLDIVSGKFRYDPFIIDFSDKIRFKPFNPLFLVSYTLNDDYSLSWPKDQYIKGYYWWSPALRWHLGAVSEIKVHNFNSEILDGLSFYLEANAIDLYIISYVQNLKALSFPKIMGLGSGVRVSLK